MISVFYDLHIHSALSPCADDDMTPNDILGMAVLNNLDLIAVTDHNCLLNTVSVVKAAENINKQSENKLIVLPGVEVSTVEEVHIICLFSCLDDALGFEEELTPYFSYIKNRVNIFGNQLIFDENDNITGEVERMLIAPTSISFDKLFLLTGKYNGAFIPAHIDKDSFSVISNLGFIPPHLAINTVEISAKGIENEFDKKRADLFAGKKPVFSSDAHYLWAISERVNSIKLPELSATAAIDFLR